MAISLDTLDHLTDHLYQSQIFGAGTNSFLISCQEKIKFLDQLDPSHSRKLFIADADPIEFLANFLAAHMAGFSVFLANPSWGSHEREQALQIMQSGFITHRNNYRYIAVTGSHPESEPELDRWILIPTGGTSGEVRFAIHTWQTLSASVQGFQDYFQVDTIYSMCVLPVFHVSGLMQFMRCFLTNGTLVLKSWKQLESALDSDFNPADFFLSLVPTQLQRILENSQQISWLSQFKVIQLGGSPSWPHLLERSRHYELPLSITYGMTETGSQVSALKPDFFLQGNNSSGQALPHANIRILDSNGELLSSGQVGKICIQANSLALGYYPQIWLGQHPFQPGDLGYLDEQGFLYIVGRQEQQIITGGEKVFAGEIEAMIRATGLVEDICVIGIPDPLWGEKVIAVYVGEQIRAENMIAQLASQLSRYKIPKCWIPADHLPRNPQGKLNRDHIDQLVNQWLQKHPTA